MEAKINIAKILKDKPQGTKLYDLLRNIDVELDKVHTTDVGTYIECTSTNEVGNTLLFDYSKLGTEDGWLEGLRILLPSKNMRYWCKFAWKKGDLLINSCGFQCIFKEWSSDDYTKFNGCYSNSRDGYEDVSNAETAKFVKLDDNTAYGYVREIEKRCGGVLNLETLEIEKTHPEFKDGDIVVYGKSVAICRNICKHTIFPYVSIDETYRLLFNDNPNVSPDECRFATEAEKQQLFSALEKEGKAWDSDKKQIVDLKPKWTPKTFDKVITRVHGKAIWTANIFSHIDQHGKYVTIGCISGYTYCLPYNDETAHLIGTTDEWKGGEG